MSVLDPFARRLRRGKGGVSEEEVLANLTHSSSSLSAAAGADEDDEGRWIRANARVTTVMGREEREAEMDKIMGVGEPMRLLRKLNDAMLSAGAAFPSVEVKFDNLTVTVDALIGEKNSLPTVVGAIADTARSIPDAAMGLCGLRGVCGRPREEVKILDGVSGVFRPGTTTLVLGPPGAGKSVLLQALSGRLGNKGSMRIDGDITFNGVSALADEFCVQQVASLVDQSDSHVATLTTRETIEFARRCQGKVPDAVQVVMDDILRRPRHYGIDPHADPDWPAFQSYLCGIDRGLKTELILNVLLLSRCAETVLGDAMLRGVSGGERRRVTTGEMLVGTGPVKLFDEISTGLDSASTFSICRAICAATRLLRVTSIVALLQPQPETYELFDEILLLTDGRVIYQGPPGAVLDHFATLDFVKPPMKDTADFLQEVTTPGGQLLFRRKRRRRGLFRKGKESDDGGDRREIVSVEEFAEAFRRSERGRFVRECVDAPVREEDATFPLTKAKYKMGPLEGFALVLGRELRIVLREKVFILGRMIQTTVLGAVIGTSVSSRARARSGRRLSLVSPCAAMGRRARLTRAVLLPEQRTQARSSGKSTSTRTTSTSTASSSSPSCSWASRASRSSLWSTETSRPSTSSGTRTSSARRPSASRFPSCRSRSRSARRSSFAASSTGSPGWRRARRSTSPSCCWSSAIRSRSARYSARSPRGRPASRLRTAWRWSS